VGLLLNSFECQIIFRKSTAPHNGLEVVEQMNVLRSPHIYEVHPRKDHRGVDLISDARCHFGRLRYGEPTPFILPPQTQQISRDFHA
jgi:hypothetical protein